MQPWLENFFSLIIGALSNVWPHAFALLAAVVAIIAASHAVVYKRDSRSAVGWVGLILFSPLVGALMYALFGINRLRRKAKALGRELPPIIKRDQLSRLPTGFPEQLAQYQHLVHFGNVAHTNELIAGNRVTPLRNGDEAYPEMLKAMASAKHSITLQTYIFDRDESGLAFANELGLAVQRGVSVRVLIDAMGSRYSFPSIMGTLRKLNINCARFLPSLVPGRFSYLNLRNHRKIMVVDGTLGFTGGMNIRHGNLMGSRHPIRDLHFKIEGPIVTHLQSCFTEDWEFTTGEVLHGKPWEYPSEAQGEVWARGVPDGPGVHFEKMRLAMLGAITAAKRSIRIQTPYFLPDSGLITVLSVARLSGIKVEIILPENNNLKIVHWAMMAQIWQLLDIGCDVFLSPPPFDHSKLMVVDEQWSLIGSTNWDARSLRLNFEFNIECFDSHLGTKLSSLFDNVKIRSRTLTLAEVNGRPYLTKIRDGVARLFSPFL